MNTFNLIQGIIVSDIKDCHSCYEKQDNENLLCSLSAELLEPLAVSVVKHLKPAVFFFIEVPSSENDTQKNIYYLDNCTTDVALAIIKRYGGILFNDGLIEFGFGSHVDNSEIYFRNNQIVQIYSPDISILENLLDVPLEKNIKTLWDIFSDENYGEAIPVELNGENVYDILDNLTEVGLYEA
ncbi:MAG: hypothetical protein GX896_05370 [Clostridiales bacterium]|nr:hypothetical protein [Clostridiales bacterium]